MSGKRASSDTQPIVPDRTEPGREPDMTVLGGDALSVAGDTSLDLVPMGGRGTLVLEPSDRAKSGETNASAVDRGAVTITSPPEELRERSTDTAPSRPAPAVVPATATLPMAQRPGAVEVAPARPKRRLVLIIACTAGLLLASGALILARKKHVEAPKAAALPVAEAPAAEAALSSSAVVPTEAPSAAIAPPSSAPAPPPALRPIRHEPPKPKHRGNDEPIF